MRIKEYVSTLEILLKQLHTEESGKSTIEKEEESLRINVENIQSIVSEASERFNSGVINILNEHEIHHEMKQMYLDARYGEYVKINIVRYKYKINREDCTVYQGNVNVLVKLKNDDGYQWHLVDYAQNEFEEIIFNDSFSYSIAAEVLNKKNITAQELENKIILGIEKMGESRVKIV